MFLRCSGPKTDVVAPWRKEFAPTTSGQKDASRRASLLGDRVDEQGVWADGCRRVGLKTQEMHMKRNAVGSFLVAVVPAGVFTSAALAKEQRTFCRDNLVRGTYAIQLQGTQALPDGSTAIS